MDTWSTKLVQVHIKSDLFVPKDQDAVNEIGHKIEIIIF